MRTPMEVHNELNVTISQLEFAEAYSRVAGLEGVDTDNARAFRRKLDRIACLVQSIESRLPGSKGVKRVA